MVLKSVLVALLKRMAGTEASFIPALFMRNMHNTKESQDIVRKMVSNVIDILRRIAKGKITFEDKVLAVEIEDAINQHTDLVADKVIENNKKVIDSYADKFAKEVEKSSY